MTSLESRQVFPGDMGRGVQIFETECVWCENNPCTSIDGGTGKPIEDGQVTQCEPKKWLMETQANNINFEDCLGICMLKHISKS